MSENHETHREEPVDSMPCPIKWFLCTVIGAAVVAAGVLGGGWLYNARCHTANEARIQVIESRLVEKEKILDIIQQDVKELLRRTNSRAVAMRPE